MSAPSVIACDVYDVAEAACVSGREVRLRLKDRQVLAGVAVDIQSTDDAEFLVLEAPGRRLLVRLSAVVEIGTEQEVSQPVDKPADGSTPR
jgi:transcriptional antiterminator Rof (Rho-off)